MTISVNSQHQAIVNVDSSHYTFEAKDGETVDGNNYGAIQSVSYENGNYVVETDKGTLTFDPNSPSLEAAKREFGVFELANTGFDELDQFNWLQIAMLVLDSEKLRSKSNRIIRTLEGQTAFQNLMNAAQDLRSASDQIRKGGLISGILQIVGGGIGCVSGMCSMLKGLKSLKVKAKTAKFDAELADTTNDLAKTRNELRKLKSLKNPSAEDQLRIKELEVQEAELQKQHETLLNDLDAEIVKTNADKAKAEAKLEKADAEVKKARKELNELKRKPLDEQDPAQIQKQKDKLERLKQKRDDLQFDVDLQDQKLASLNATKSKATRLADGTTDADLAEVGEWNQKARSTLMEINTMLNEMHTSMQKIAQMMQALQSVFGGIAGLVNSQHQANAQDYEADSKEDDAQGALANTARDEANSDLQDAQRAIQSFLQTWEKYHEAVQSVKNQLVQA